MLFKTIRASFEVKGTSDNGKEYHYIFIIKRNKSGAFAYGDRSSHILTLYPYGENEQSEKATDYYYDTRYDHIPTNKEKWVEEWKKYIKDNWINVNFIDLLLYEEKEMEID